MFILYPEYAMATIIPGGDKYILRKGDDVILPINGDKIHYCTYDITKNKEIIFRVSLEDTQKIIKSNNGGLELTFGPENLNMLANMLYGVGVNSVMIESTWVLYSVENQTYYKLGDKINISSRRLNLSHRIVSFKEAYIGSDGAVVILDDDKVEYKLTNSSYTGKTYMEDIFSGIPFYADIHCCGDSLKFF